VIEAPLRHFSWLAVVSVWGAEEMWDSGGSQAIKMAIKFPIAGG
jgi:hypothetical protein